MYKDKSGRRGLHNKKPVCKADGGEDAGSGRLCRINQGNRGKSRLASNVASCEEELKEKFAGHKCLCFGMAYPVMKANP
ncbi:hypothetical protein VFPPC_15585 [Pochonia chlamydosporia 170]|uniref:Uncharacterized protein n=1 Tax=Pochonia chlamydosporia 170 TaxID=1380566 RepID=A0A179FZT0_METCM|nr:hypothetical protein VFPPC_15585 [Pochonia chlamydosporia 170]OAQ70479.1 hypothetical protein VFPPC_15585 [Pochonia chlamydosporia 170]